jgi:GTPase Era involved in 16S rRNA processing
VHALLHCERPTQKPMLLGKGGSVIKAIGTEARAGLEELLGAGCTWTCTSPSSASGRTTRRS